MCIVDSREGGWGGGGGGGALQPLLAARRWVTVRIFVGASGYPVGITAEPSTRARGWGGAH